MFPQGHAHGQSAERDARHKVAASHPNEDDLNAAKAFGQEVLAAVGQ